ncbi:membrane protease YdiL (CAAX protease family) [Erythromicrobium ramosum]|uniref:CPBP family intramembrane metalloprotease n=1 Tax=Erythrobacter ramosus TaxID=35811 RepID=A0A6I4UHD8_9SPHN|nr:membrane protease YdiL (CAAX protease family) [Erythrobacter ramosus]MXP37294.1 CPBP family intramembrane metalloprotease [Erythrobacter ramosus]
MSARLTPAGALGARARIADVMRFALRPTFAEAPTVTGWQAVKALAVLLALSFAIMVPLGLMLNLVDPAMTIRLQRAEPPPKQLRDLFVALAFAPIFEEMLFRAWLSGRIAALRYGLYGLVALALLLADIVLETSGNVLSGMAVLAVFVGLLQWGLTNDTERAVPAWFIRHFRWFVWGSSLMFGLIHLGNDDTPSGLLGLIAVTPQMIGGVLLAYTRTRLGLAWAILHHGLYNAVFFGVPFALR